MVELAERLVQRIDRADWAVFSKNGTDATTLAVSLARVATDKPVILMARGAYHGAANWCSSNEYTILDERQHVIEFEYNDVSGLRGLFGKYAGQIASVIVTPYHHATYASPRLVSDDTRVLRNRGLASDHRRYQGQLPGQPIR